MCSISGRAVILAEIGRAIATRFAAEGSKVGIFDIAAEGAAQTVAAIRAAGGVAEVFLVDIFPSGGAGIAVGCRQPLGRLRCATQISAH